MKKSKIAIVGLLLIVIPILFFILSLNKNRSFESQAIIINKSVIQKEVERTKKFYKYSNQNLNNYPTLEEDAKDRAIENAIIENYAELHNIKVTEDEIDQRYQQKIQTGGEQKLLTQLAQMYGMNKADYMQVLKQDILREKIQSLINQPMNDWLISQEKSLKVEIK